MCLAVADMQPQIRIPERDENLEKSITTVPASPELDRSCNCSSTLCCRHCSSCVKIVFPGKGTMPSFLHTHSRGHLAQAFSLGTLHSEQMTFEFRPTVLSLRRTRFRHHTPAEGARDYCVRSNATKRADVASPRRVAENFQD